MFITASFIIGRVWKQMSLHWWTDTSMWCVCPYGETLFSSQEEWSTDSVITWMNSKLYAVWRKPDRKGHIFRDSIFFSWHAQNRQIYRDRKQISGCLGLGVARRKWRMTADGFLIDKNAPKLMVAMVIQLCQHTKNLWIVHLERGVCVWITSP